MPTNVLPAWIKYLLLIVGVAADWWSFADRTEQREHGNSAYLTSGSFGGGSGFTVRAFANIRQFVTNPLEPTPLPGAGTVILRAPGTNYYRDQPSH